MADYGQGLGSQVGAAPAVEVPPWAEQSPAVRT